MPVAPIHLPSAPKRILLIKPSALGDVVHGLPILALLRRRFPKAHIAWLVAPAFSSLLNGHPLLDEVIRFDRRGDADAGPLRGAIAFSDLVRDISNRNFDLVIDLQGLARSALLTWATVRRSASDSAMPARARRWHTRTVSTR
ncbi:MAG: hypothetical protein QM770_09625 [Tepidisphaeraceae bacterium]